MAKEEVKKPTQAVTAPPREQLPAFMANKQGAGLEKMGSGDYEIPRVQILDAISGQVTDLGCKPGQIWHTVLETAIDGPVKMVPLFVSKAYMLWRPRDDGGGILARADDGVNWTPSKGQFEVFIDKQKKQKRTWVLKPTVAESRLAEWGTYDDQDESSQPAATQMINVAVAFPDMPEWSPSVLTFQRGRIKVGRKFIGKLKLSQAPIYGRLFTMGAFDDENNNGDPFKNYRIEAAGLVQDEAEFKRYEDLYHMFSKLGLKVKADDDMQETGPASGADRAEATAAETEVAGRGARAY